MSFSRKRPRRTGASARMALDCLAPAKINLTLHVTGRRSDGYHLLDSLVVFADTGDVVTIHPSRSLSLSIVGPYAADVPSGPDNLVLRAARLTGTSGAALTLNKRLPVAAGLGGGSSDAAAALRGLAEFGGLAVPDPATQATLGADVPVCLLAKPSRMRGIGEILDPVSDVPPVWFVLANPGIALPTPQVFAALDQRCNAPMPQHLPAWPDAPALIAWLAQMRNDLEPPAIGCAPVIGDVLAALAATEGCRLARMSGSGSSCFGLFEHQPAARRAAALLAARHPNWWITEAGLASACDILPAVRRG